MKTIIHVNQHTIRRNLKTGTREPVITVKCGRQNQYTHEVKILDKHGELVATVMYRPDAPLNCGARVWIETTATCELSSATVELDTAATTSPVC